MARRLGFLSLCIASGAPLALAGDGWGGWGGSLDDMMGKVNDAAEKVKDGSKQAYGMAKIKACGLKVSSDIDAANKTMTDQLKSDCESAASKVSLVHDHALSYCLSMGVGQIARTIKQQAENLEKDCLEAIDSAPGNWKSSIEDWASKEENAIDTSLGSTVEDAMSKVKGKFGDEQRKFASTLPLFREGAIRAASIAGAGAAAMTVVGAAAAAALRLRRAHLAVEASPILAAEDAAEAEAEAGP